MTKIRGGKIWAYVFGAAFPLLVLSMPNIAHAGAASSFWDLLTGDGGIPGFFAGLLYPIVELLAKILGLIGELVNYAVQPGGESIIRSAFVETGWEAMRDITNLVFILVLLGIALDYILFNSVGVKRALPRLLLVAILINFSLPIAGVVLDFANVFTVFFINQATGGKGLTETFANYLHLTDLYKLNESSMTSIAAATGNILTNTIFIILLLIGMIFVFIALAIMFFIRYFYISILLVVLPLVLVASILPQMGGHFKKWTNKFIQWTMFAPAATFFLYLTIVFLGSYSTPTSSLISVVGIGTDLTKFIFAWMLMLMSLFAAQSMGIYGASTAIATWGRGTKWARGKAWGATKTGAAAAGRRMKADERVEKLATNIQKAVPGWLGGGMLASGTRNIGARTKAAMERQEALTSEQKARYEKYSDVQLRSEYEVFAKSKIPGDGARAAQVAEMLARRGSLNILNEDGTTNKDKTEEMAMQAYAFAKANKNKAAMDGIMKANPIAYQKIVEKEWGELEKQDRLSIKRDDKGNVIERRKKDTGETFEDAKNKAFEKMTATDFENLKGSWDEKATRTFLFSGAMGSNHIRLASNANDHTFLKHLSETLEGMSAEEVEALQKKSPALVSFLTSGRGKDFVKVPSSFKEKTKEGRTEEGMDSSTRSYMGL